MSASYSYEQLKQMRGQAVKDVWHSMIGKPAGIKNTTGLKNGDEIIHAILKAQQNPGESPKHLKQEEPKEMPPKPDKKKPGPKPGPKPKATLAPIPVQRTAHLLAYESVDIPIVPGETKRISVKKLVVDDTMYFLDSTTNILYTNGDGRPGSVCGRWDPQARHVHDVDS